MTICSDCGIDQNGGGTTYWKYDKDGTQIGEKYRCYNCSQIESIETYQRDGNFTNSFMREVIAFKYAKHYKDKLTPIQMDYKKTLKKGMDDLESIDKAVQTWDRTVWVPVLREPYRKSSTGGSFSIQSNGEEYMFAVTDSCAVTMMTISRKRDQAQLTMVCRDDDDEQTYLFGENTHNTHNTRSNYSVNPLGYHSTNTSVEDINVLLDVVKQQTDCIDWKKAGYVSIC